MKLNTSNRRRAGALTAAVLAAVLAAAGGCGIPDNTEVKQIGTGPSIGFASDDDVPLPPRTRTDSLNQRDLVKNYLEAAVGDFNEAFKRVQEFLSPSAVTTFKPPNEIKVVHLVDTPLVEIATGDVDLEVRTIGKLMHNGSLITEPDASVTRYKLEVRTITGKDGLFVTKAPPVLLLSDEALGNFYERRTIYFWNREHTALVPDIRYLPKQLPKEQEPQQIIKWLIEGPPSWLSEIVEPLPEGTELIGNVPAVSNGKLQINLNPQSVVPPDDPDALDRLRRQLMWSLRANLSDNVLELRIGNQEPVDYGGNDYLSSNPSSQLASTPERFLIYNGQIHRRSLSPNAPQPIPVIPPEANRNVKAAALAHDPLRRQYAALVTVEKDRQVLQVGAAAIDQRAKLHRVSLPGGSPGQPVWAISSDDAQTGAIGLITVGGRLYSYSANGAAVRPVAWPGPQGWISAVAVAPDGRRVAMVVGGSLYLAALTADGNGPRISAYFRVQVPALQAMSAVDWGTETSLLVAGTLTGQNRVAIVDTTIDGSSGQAQPDIGTDAVTYLAAYPVSPTSNKPSPDVVQYMANGSAYDALIGPEPERIGVADLATPVADPPAAVAPISPFYLR
ncbi:LpqB family beta-propeller domain-containing protein [Actinoplanes sp. NPDC051859]|uniref:LpqB family beta-propeller domain-containing protein n=1 Tax=Actinoplanes sp. NPDC051859 TaxID=3363909 RepID=UPI0037903888